MKTVRMMTVAVLGILLSLPTNAATKVALGSAKALRGGTVVVPVTIDVDPAGTLTRAAGNPIQAIALKVTYDPNNIKAIKIRRAGVAASLLPMFEAAPETRGSISYIASFEINAAPFVLAESNDTPADLVAEVEVTLAENAHGHIDLVLDPETTMLSNQRGTVTLNSKDGSLTLQDGYVDLGGRQRGARRNN